MAMNGSDGAKQFIGPKVMCDAAACPACGQHAVIMRQNYLISPRGIAVVGEAPEKVEPLETYKLCLWCLGREIRAPSKGEKRWTLRATAGPGASPEPARQAPGGRAGFPSLQSNLDSYHTSIDMGVGEHAEIPSPEWLAEEGYGETWNPVDVPEGLR